MNRSVVLRVVLALSMSVGVRNACAQWASSVSPAENFFHSLGFQSALDRGADYNFIRLQEQIRSGKTIGDTYYPFEGDMINNTSIGVIISDSPGATGTNNGPVSAQSNLGSRGGAGSGSINHQGSFTIQAPAPKPNPCIKECPQ
ncbi:MAG: hypothetical protein G01um101448_322 [Parcubacteria group bacterium Gr01-1014_48]|nr:MAG: hypothetical protein Greene041614_1231 [Parcubacteria group bacterium Greene0416_14]TSC74118.1 MAG: hypothetical protein G01um101448_322 [Parcubacteria group bacterium Gr01-1014_48]TSD01482.1 MAG: hypothetical protein Greene101415_198 [Parcubacteria group bacterium Greene1014_15]TSD07142.1 MAG: hypothetical protein Greene07144_1000 [Parcubacteria group bacterium Greene0714_4]